MSPGQEQWQLFVTVPSCLEAFPQGILLMQKVLYVCDSPRWEQARAGGTEGCRVTASLMQGRELKLLEKGDCPRDGPALLGISMLCGGPPHVLLAEGRC